MKNELKLRPHFVILAWAAAIAVWFLFNCYNKLLAERYGCFASSYRIEWVEILFWVSVVNLGIVPFLFYITQMEEMSTNLIVIAVCNLIVVMPPLVI